MKSRNTYSLVASLLLTAIACARQEEPDYDYGDEEIPDETGGTSSGTGGKSTLPVGKSGSTSAGTGGSGTKLPPAGSGGKGGTKSTGGTGGKATGGSSGSGGGGSGGSGGGGEDPVNMPVDGISVTFKAIEGQGDVDFVGGDLFVLNESGQSFSLANLKIRYYFTNELNSPPLFIWNWGQFGPIVNRTGIECDGAVVEMPSPKPGANFYVEISCPPGDLPTAGDLRTSWKAGNQGSGKLTQTGDWSYVADGEAPKVVVMDGNTVIWGVVP